MRDATTKYKASLKKVNPDFDAKYYNRLIFEAYEPQTLIPEDPVGFDQLNSIGTWVTTVGPSTLVRDVEAFTSQATEWPTEKPTDPQPTSPLFLHLSSRQILQPLNL